MTTDSSAPKKQKLSRNNALILIVAIVAVVLLVAVLVTVAYVVSFNAREITVSFVWEEELYDSVTIKRHDPIEFPVLSLEGYTFLGWAREGDAEILTESFFKSYDFSEDIELFARWAPIDPVTVTYESNGGTPLDPVQVPKGYPIAKMGQSERKGFILLGWAYDKQCLRVYNPDEDVITEDITLYAKWVPSELDETVKTTVGYVTGEGAPMAADSTVAIGAELTFPDLHYTGHILEGWYSDPEYRYAIDARVLVTEQCTVYAKWKETDALFTVSFVMPEDAPIYPFGTYAYDALVSRTDFDFYWDEYHILVGVYADRAHETIAIFDYFIREDHTYYVVYREQVVPRVKVYFYDGDTLLVSSELNEGEPIGYYEAPVKPGYDFVNWYVDADLITPFDFEHQMAEDNLKIYAKYRESTQYADDYFEYEELTDSQGSYLRAVSEIDVTRTEVAIADECNGLPVREIAADLFKGRLLQTVTIGANVRTIGDRAFEGSALQKVTIPNSVRTIGWRAFFGCQLTSVEISGQVDIGDYAFAQCGTLTTFAAPLVLSIGSHAFERCYALNKADIRVVMSMEEAVFSECRSLGEVNMSDAGITVIPASTFYGCASLSTFDVPSLVTTLGTNSFGGSGLRSFNTKNVETIGGYVFLQCSRLEDVTVGSALNSITPSTFAECKALRSFTVMPNNKVFASNGDGCLYGKDETTNEINSLILYAGDSDTYILPVGVKSIAQQAFAYTKNLQSMFVASGNEAFCALDGNLYTADMTKMVHYASAKEDATFTVPKTVANIASFCFMDADNLETVKLLESVRSVSVWAFYGLDKLEKIVCTSSETSFLVGDGSSDMVSVYLCPHVSVTFPEADEQVGE